MDRPLGDRAGWRARRRARWAAIAVVLLLLAYGIYALVAHFSVSRLRVERDKLMISTVERGVFQEYVLAGAEVRKKVANAGGTGGFEIRAMIDPRDVAKIAVGQPGEVDAGGAPRAVKVSRIDAPGPRVAGVLLQLAGPPPDWVRPGQALRARIDLAPAAMATLLPRGGFFQRTGGRWVYLVDDRSGTAAKRRVRLGRQNPDVYEVLSGLRPGDRVITSSYDFFDDVEELVLTR
jgi:HlyD family secretion protein